MTALPEDVASLLGALEPLLGRRATLDASRVQAPTPVELVRQVAAGCDEPPRLRALAQGLDTVVRAIAENFPDNLFWDLDYLVCRMWRAGSPEAMQGFARRVEALCRGFGSHSELSFRYAHDFLYGFDWSRWVAARPEERVSVGPFDDAFFDYLEARRQQLLELIARDDEKYGALRGARYRNPFIFSREPDEEARLHCALVEEDLIPVKAWRMDGERRWELPYTDLRAELACRLGIPARRKTA